MTAGPLPSELDRRFEAIVFDWDGTAVPDRRADAAELRRVIEALCASGVDVAVVSGTHVGNVDGQLGARPTGPGRLHLLLNRGSEVFCVDGKGVELVHRRTATAQEEAALSAAAELAVRHFAHRGLEVRIVSSRLNRRKIDIIPEGAWADPSKARLAELLVAVQARLARFGLALPRVVEMTLGAARDAGLADPRVTSDAKHVEIGLTDKGDSARWILRNLRERGIGPGLVLIAGDEVGPLGGLPGSDSLMVVPEAARSTVVSVGVEPEGVAARVVAFGGGPDAFLGILRDQLVRRRRRDLPELDGDPAWTLHVDGFDPVLERVRQTQLTIADGRFGTAGSAAFERAGRPRVLAGGVYDGHGTESRLVACPVWIHIAQDLGPPTEQRRTLDLRAGVLREEVTTAQGSFASVSFSSMARPGLAGIRARGAEVMIATAPMLRVPDGDIHVERSGPNGEWTTVATSAGGAVIAAAMDERLDASATTTVDRLAAYDVTDARTTDGAVAVEKLGEAKRDGFERILAEHRATWARRWENADVVIEGDEELQRDVRFALFHLMAAVADSGEAAVGARGLSGPAYRGHVFWDADVFVLPFLAATHPESARAMLEYRLRRLPVAEARARAEGRAGARFPWESAREGVEVAPSEGRDQTGRVVPIRTGEREEHVVADVAWAAALCLDWTGDEAFGAAGAARLLTATARYWASRVRLDDDGRAHIDGVIGPDEYHEEVADNAFTNVMARWNLRRAASLVPRGPDVAAEEAKRWVEIADALVDGFDSATGVYEQFAGFRALEPLIIAQIAKTRPIDAAFLLGRDRVARAQVLKQADVLMLHHMVPDDVAPGSLLPNLLFYEPRTAHGSSLSPGIHAALFARAWRLDEAVRWLRLTSRIDLDDLSESTAGGLHLAAMGSVWQALAFGFAGLRPRGIGLTLDPRLPEPWRAFELRVRFRGSRVRVRIEPRSTFVHADPPVPVIPRGGEAVLVSASGARFALRSRAEVMP
jgi:trehalose/maltose hydrolase-like predicted phosphorylase